MNQKIVDYLQENKDNYSRESLAEQLKESGYDVAEINEGVNFVYNLNINTKVNGKSKFKTIGIGCGIVTLVLIVVAGGIIFYMYGVGKDILESDDLEHQKMVEEMFVEDVQMNEGVGEYNLDTGIKNSIVADTDNVTNNSGNDDIVINGIHFSLDNRETLVTGGVEYVYLPVDKSINQKFVIIIPKRVSYDSEGKRDFYKSLGGDMTDGAIIGEWADENNDEFGFYIGSYDKNIDKTEYKLFDITNKGAFQSVLTVVAEGRVEQNDIEGVITDFRRASMDKSVEFKTNDITLQPPADSTRDIEFNFDQGDFIFDVTTLFEYGDEHRRYILASEKQKHEKTRYMLISKLEKAVYDSADAGCKHMKSAINSAAEVTDILFEDNEECGFLLSGVLNGKNLYEWNKVMKNGMHGYTYSISKDVDDELPVEIIDKITNKFKDFEY